MSFVTTQDGTQIFYKDWGPKNAQPIVFHHSWPLSSDDWDAQMLFFLGKGYRVVAHDRRGHGRSSQVGEGHDMDHYAADVAAVVEHLSLRDTVHIGHSTGGGEAAHFAAHLGNDANHREIHRASHRRHRQARSQRTPAGTGLSGQTTESSSAVRVIEKNPADDAHAGTAASLSSLQTA